MKFWKSALSLAIALVVCLSLAACGGDRGDAGEAPAEESVNVRVAALKGRLLLSAGSRPYLSVKLAGKEPLEGLSEVLRAMESARSPAA